MGDLLACIERRLEHMQLDDSFSEQLEKFGLSPADIEDEGTGSGRSLANLPQISTDKLWKPSPMQLHSYTLWSSGAKVHYGPGTWTTITCRCCAIR